MARERMRGDPSEEFLKHRQFVIEQSKRFFDEMTPEQRKKYLKANENLEDSLRSGDINPHPGRIIRGS